MGKMEKTTISSLVVLFLVLWLGFLLHQSPRFAGSLMGGIFGVVGALLMLVPLLYLFVKRIKILKNMVTKRVPMRTLLTWHVYAGVLGPIFVLIHTGHKFESWLGITLTAMTLIVVLSGFIGRYLMNQFSVEIREKKKLLAELEVVYQQAAEELSKQPTFAQSLQPFSGLLGRVLAVFFIRKNTTTPITSAHVFNVDTLLHLSESLADVEYAIKTHEAFKKWFGMWLKIHIVISIVLYVLLGLHVWSAIHFGLRWFE